MPHEIDKQEFQKDYGFFYIYKRADRKKPTWNVFIKLDGQTGFTRKSLKTEDVFKAKEKAELFYKELLSIGSTKSYPFDKVVSEYKPSISKDAFARLKYVCQFWKGKNISALSDRDVGQFITYRKKLNNPKNTTLRREFGIINQFFQYAYDHSYTKEIIKFPSVKITKNPRPSFSEYEWIKIVSNLSDWISKSNHPKDIRARTYLKALVLLLGNSGIRPMNEIIGLTWNHLDRVIFNLDGRKSKIFIIYVDGKTGRRPVIPNQGTEKILLDLQQFAKPKSDNEFIFVNRDGSTTKSFKKSFRSFLSYYGLQENPNGEVRTLYSLRHYYCECAIRNGINLWHVAENAGTSVEMLKSYYVDRNFNDVVNSFANSKSLSGSRSLFDN